MTPFLSIIIAHRNEPGNLLETIQSIRATTPLEPVEIIVVDDASTGFISESQLNGDANHVTGDVSRPKNLRLFVNSRRRGLSTCRDYGSKRSDATWLMFTDAHMRFQPGWYENFMAHAVTADPKTLFNGPYFYHRDSPQNHTHTIWGADVSFYHQSRTLPGTLKLLGIIPRPERPPCLAGEENNPFEIPAVIGANYFIRRDFFRLLGGTPCFVNWCGAFEWVLSVKTWLAGGRVLLLPDVRVHHILYPTGAGENGYGKETSQSELLYNKLAGAFQVMPAEMFQQLLEALPMDPGSDTVIGARALLEQWGEHLAYWRNYFLTRVQQRDIDWLCGKFDLDHPLDICARTHY